jgi:hypothetical protein
MAQLTIYASADAHVNSGNPTTNYGSANSMEFGLGDIITSQSRCWIQFDLSSIPAGAVIVDANLYLKPFYGGGTDYVDCVIDVQRCTDNSWTEGGVTWNNAPNGSMSGTVNKHTISGMSPYYATAVKDEVVASIADGKLSFRLIEDVEGTGGYAFFSTHDYTANGCSKLVVDYNYVFSGGSAFSSDGSGDGDWQLTNNAAHQDDWFTSCITDSNNGAGITSVLSAMGFGFSIPSTATIDGITVSVYRKAAINTTRTWLTDLSLRLIKGGYVVGDDKASFIDKWPTTTGWNSYGTLTDLWGTTWTPTQINASDFGIAISAQQVGTNLTVDTAYIDYLYATVYYTYVAPTGTPKQWSLSRYIRFGKEDRNQFIRL